MYFDIVPSLVTIRYFETLIAIQHQSDALSIGVDHRNLPKSSLLSFLCSHVLTSMEDSPSDALHHWNDNAWTYLNIGLEMGNKMVELLELRNTTKVEKFDHNLVRLYPNPSTDFIRFETETFANHTFSLVDVNGQVVLQKGLASNVVQLDIGGGGL